ncbi:MAG: hypothetical protein QXJ06_03040 [Candidatus Aenigmatarchaeota archaeon]
MKNTSKTDVIFDFKSQKIVNILSSLDNLKGITTNELFRLLRKEKFSIASYTFTNRIRKLEKYGIIERVLRGNRKVVRLNSTLLYFIQANNILINDLERAKQDIEKNKKDLDFGELKNFHDLIVFGLGTCILNSIRVIKRDLKNVENKDFLLKVSMFFIMKTITTFYDFYDFVLSRMPSDKSDEIFQLIKSFYQSDTFNKFHKEMLSISTNKKLLNDFKKEMDKSLD